MMQSVIIFAVTEGKTKQTKRPGRAQNHTVFGTLFLNSFYHWKKCDYAFEWYSCRGSDMCQKPIKVQTEP